MGKDRLLRVRDTPLFSVLNSAAFFAAGASAVIGGASWVLTFTTWTSFMSSSYFVPFFALAFPLIGWSVLVVYMRHPEWRGGGRLGRQQRQDRAREQQAALLAAIPARLRIPLGVLFAAVVVTSLLSPSSLPGNPEYDPSTGHYFYDEHGTVVLISRAAYLHAVTAQDRLFLGGALLFTSIALAVTWQERRLRRDLAAPDRWLRPVRPRPRFIPPAPLLAVAIVAGLAGAVASASLLITRVDAYNTGGIYLRTGHPVAARLAADHYTVFVGCTESMTCPKVPPAALSVSVISGGVISTSPDPSHDDLSEAAQPFVGKLSFTVPTSETVTLDLTANLGQPAFVVPSEGEEVRALAGWIALAILSILVFFAVLIPLIMLAAWRLGFGAPAAGGPQARAFNVHGPTAVPPPGQPE